MFDIIQGIALTLVDKSRMTVGLVIFGITLLTAALAKFHFKVSFALASIVTTLWAIH